MRRRAVVLVALPLVVAACGGGRTAEPDQSASRGDSEAGRALFVSGGCADCHTFEPAGAAGTVGPDLGNVASDAERADADSLEAYVFTSIEQPSAYVVPGFPDGLMPDYGAQLDDGQIADLVAFLTPAG